jgi:type IV pilus assembly protein PilX
MTNRLESIHPRSRQSGVVLFVALILLVILSMIGVTVARMQTVEERMARNENERQLSMQAAEAALRNAEDSLLTSPGISQFNNTGGYYVMSPTTGSVLPTINWNVPAQVTTYTGPALTAIPTAVQAPKIVIEYMGGVALPGEDQANPPITYRVTVQAASADGTPSTMLQSIYR